MLFVWPINWSIGHLFLLKSCLVSYLISLKYNLYISFCFTFLLSISHYCKLFALTLFLFSPCQTQFQGVAERHTAPTYIVAIPAANHNNLMRTRSVENFAALRPPTHQTAIEKCQSTNATKRRKKSKTKTQKQQHYPLYSCHGRLFARLRHTENSTVFKRQFI